LAAAATKVVAAASQQRGKKPGRKRFSRFSRWISFGRVG